MTHRRLPPARRVDVLSHGIVRKVPHLQAFLPEAGSIGFRLRPSSATEAIAGWGYRPTANRARRLAEKRGIPYWALEDGFLRSAGLGSDGAPPLSLIADDRGIYFDATRPSRLEELLNTPGPLAENLLRQGRDLVAFKNAHALSKYNAAPPFDPTSLPSPAGRSRILVVDQTAGDASIAFGLAKPDSFHAMLDAAAAENPGAQIIVKRHPAVASGYRQGLIDTARHPGVLTLDTDCNPIGLLRTVDTVYTVTSLLGFEALLLGLPVHCFGMPFYAGWGATEDALACARRTQARSPAEIAAAALIGYARYVDPFTGEPCSAMLAAKRLLTYKQRADANRGHWSLAGIAFWKRAPLRQHLGGPTSSVRFHKTLEAAVADAKASKGRPVVWSARERPEHAPLMRDANVIRMEDGFIRSAGLGSDFHGASSIALDNTGIYYDPASNSRLERILAEHPFPPELKARAAGLIGLLLREKITKYNTGSAQPLTLQQDRPVLFIPGQVEGDASIRRGGAGMETNTALAETVRKANPTAFLLYKEHPDVLAGNRKGKLSAAAESLIDARADSNAIPAILEHPAVAAVHTLTSLTGFEALIRGKPVATYGQPFYAGWGLTTDHAPIAHRTRRLSLEELTAGALLLYPRYIDPVTGLPCEAEFLVERLASLIRDGGPVRTDGLYALPRYARAIRYGLFPPRHARTY